MSDFGPTTFQPGIVADGAPGRSRTGNVNSTRITVPSLLIYLPLDRVIRPGLFKSKAE